MAKMVMAKMVIANVLAESIVVCGPPPAEQLPAAMVAAQKRAVLVALEPPAPAPEQSG
jgi:hypothetical protein